MSKKRKPRVPAALLRKPVAERLALLQEVLEARVRTGEVVRSVDANGQPLYRLASVH
jgi:hypothetical protein